MAGNLVHDSRFLKGQISLFKKKSLSVLTDMLIFVKVRERDHLLPRRRVDFVRFCQWGINLVTDQSVIAPKPFVETLSDLSDLRENKKTYVPCFVQQTQMMRQVDLNRLTWWSTAAKHIKTHLLGSEMSWMHFAMFHSQLSCYLCGLTSPLETPICSCKYLLDSCSHFQKQCEMMCARHCPWF